MKARFGFTLIELLAAMVIIGILASIANRSVHELVERARVVRAVSELRSIDTQIASYFATHNRYPASLDEAGISGRDPWGHPYAYMSMEGVKGKGKMRKDRFLVPLNSDYDLYSHGPDGESKAPLTAQQSRDDILRAHDGSFIGPARDL